MRPKTARPSRSRANARRVLFTLAALVLVAGALAIVVQVSVAGVFRNRQPRLALAWSPPDASARAQLAGRLLSNFNPADEVREAVVGLARDALRRDLLQPVALRSLALASASRPQDGSGGQPAQLMLEANRISRRDQLTQLWLIDYARQQGDVSGMVRHFDIALRTSDGNRATLFQILAMVSTDPRVRPRIEAMLREKPRWALPFIAHLIDSGEHPAHTVRLAVPILDASNPVERGVIRSMLSRLSAAQEYDLAWAAFETTILRRRVESDSGLRNPSFEQVGDFEPFTWTLAQEEDLSASRERWPGDRGFFLRMTATNGGSGTAARQLVRLSPGRYSLTADAGDVAESADARPELRVMCAAPREDVQLLAVKPQRSGSGPIRFGGNFAVSDDCRFQWIAVVLTGDEDAETTSPWLDNVSLAAARRD